MAEERPDFIMSSIVFAPSGYYVKKDGKKMEARFFYGWDDDMFGWHYKDGEQWIKAEEADSLFVEFDENKDAKHHYTDIVEEGAATDQLFSTRINSHLFAAQADAFLNEHPHLITFLQENPDAVSAWMLRAGYTVSPSQKKKSMAFDMKKWLFGENTDTPTAESLDEMRTALNAAKEEITALRKERDEWKVKFETAENTVTSLSATVEQLKASVADLTTKLSNIAQQPAAQPTGGDTPPGEPATQQKKRAYQRNPINEHLFNK
jgi:hypothetical protein